MINYNIYMLILYINQYITNLQALNNNCIKCIGYLQCSTQNLSSYEQPSSAVSVVLTPFLHDFFKVQEIFSFSNYVCPLNAQPPNTPGASIRRNTDWYRSHLLIITRHICLCVTAYWASQVSHCTIDHLFSINLLAVMSSSDTWEYGRTWNNNTSYTGCSLNYLEQKYNSMFVLYQTYQHIQN